jgi:hypothetical protein
VIVRPGLVRLKPMAAISLFARRGERPPRPAWIRRGCTGRKCSVLAGRWPIRRSDWGQRPGSRARPGSRRRRGPGSAGSSRPSNRAADEHHARGAPQQRVRTSRAAYPGDVVAIRKHAHRAPKQQCLALLDDRDRIAEDLHNDVIRQLSGPGWPCRELPPLLSPVRPARASSTRSATWAAPSPGSGPACSIYDPCPLVLGVTLTHTCCMESLNTPVSDSF